MKTIIYYTQPGHNDREHPLNIIIDGDSIVDCKKKFRENAMTKFLERELL